MKARLAHFQLKEEDRTTLLTALGTSKKVTVDLRISKLEMNT